MNKPEVSPREPAPRQKNPSGQNPASAPADPFPEDAAPRFANGTAPEVPPRARGFLVFVCVVTILTGVTLLRTLSGDTPFFLIGGVYWPSWFSAGVVGMALSAVTILALRSYSSTRAAGTGLVFFNCCVIYAFLAWHLLFH